MPKYAPRWRRLPYQAAVHDRAAAQHTGRGAESLAAALFVFLALLLQPVWLVGRLRGSPGGTPRSRRDPESPARKGSSRPPVLFPQRAEKRRERRVRNYAWWAREHRPLLPSLLQGWQPCTEVGKVISRAKITHAERGGCCPLNPPGRLLPGACAAARPHQAFRGSGFHMSLISFRPVVFPFEFGRRNRTR